MTALPGSFTTPSIAPVYADGIPVQLCSVPSAKSSSAQDFWSSQPRPAGDPHAEQLIISLAQPRLINYISLDLPHFPHTLSVYWWDGAKWRPVTGPRNTPLQIVTTGSVPSVIDNPAALAAGLNPHHYGAGHWVHYDEQITPVTTTRLLLSGARPPKTSGLQKFPVDPCGCAAPYPLGVQNLDIGSRLLSSPDVPAMPRSPTTLTMRQPFTTTVDINGSPAQVAVRENRASDLLRGATWRCAPQPASSAVACLYLDSRDSSGSAQLIDRFFLDPVTSGVRFNLFYSPVPPPPGAVFAALDDPLLPSVLQPGGTQLPVTGPQGITFPAAPSWLTLSSQAAGTVADEPWWTGIEIMPAFGDSDGGTYVIADAGLLQLYFSAGTWTVTMPLPGEVASPNQPSGAVLAQWSFSFSPGDRLQFVAGFDGRQFFVWTPRGTMILVPAATVPPAPAFRFGGLQNVTPGYPVLAGNFQLAAFVLKQEQLDLSNGGPGGIPVDFLAFAADATGYVSPPLASEQATTVNAVARFSPLFVLGSVSPWGFVGGLGSAYQACPWVPVQRDYKLARGYVEFNPVLAAAWKFEFTCLQPEPFEYFRPSAQAASFFPASLVPDPARVTPGTPAALEAGLEINQSVAPSVNFGDAPRRSADAPAGSALPTEALYATDPAGAGQMAARGGPLYNFQPWQPAAVIPGSQLAGPSSYQQNVIPVTSRIAYFVALSGIAMFRLDYTAADDTEQYLDTFADTRNIDPATLTAGGWAWKAGTGLVAPGNLAGIAQAASVTFNSAHPLTGVQFATAQSDPVQLLDDPDFSDPGFASWGPVGDAMPLAASEVSTQLGTMVSVSRGSGSAALDTGQPGSWAALESAYATWSALMAAVPSWYGFGRAPASSAIGGIGYTGKPVPTTAAGRLHAAARVFTPVGLSAPLYLQLLDGATGAVIAEAERPVSGGGVTEWFAGFTLGEGAVSASTWAQVTAAYPAWSAITLAGPAWSQIDTSITPLGTTVTARLIQKDSTADTWSVDNISVFEDALVWEFSNDGGQSWYQAYDVRNNPRGVVTFPPAAPGQGTQLKWRLSAYRPGVSVSSLAIRPWYVTWPRGVMPRPAGIGHGPNLSPADHYPAIENDPRWRLSSSPIPDSWFFRVRQALAITAPSSDFPGPALPPADATLGGALVYEPPAIAAQEPETFTDIYTDVYTDTYAPADAGDVYTDSYSDTFGSDYTSTTGTVRSAAASFAATGLLAVTAIRVPPLASGLGADLGPVAASDPSVSAWIAATGRPLPVRRIALGNQIPATLAASVAAGDAGVRRVLLDFRPDATTTPAQLDTFLASCQAGGLQAAVSLWAGADRDFTNLQDYLALLPDYAAIIRRNGYQHVFTIGNDSITRNALVAWYPGDALVDVIAPTFWCTGPAPGSGGDTLALAASFADAHGKPLGLAGFGVDRAKFTAAQGDAFLGYVRALFASRKRAGKPSADLIYQAAGSYALAGAPAQLITDYQQIAAAL